MYRPNEEQTSVPPVRAAPLRRDHRWQPYIGVISALGLLATFAGLNADLIQPLLNRDSAEIPEDPPLRSAVVVGGVEPYLYADFDSDERLRKQPCDGLLAICLGQPIETAYLTDVFGAEPFETTFIEVENEAILSSSWFLPQVAEGSPDAKLAIAGRSPATGVIPEPCTPWGVVTRYDDWLLHADSVLLTQISVETVAPADFEESECPRRHIGTLPGTSTSTHAEMRR